MRKICFIFCLCFLSSLVYSDASVHFPDKTYDQVVDNPRDIVDFFLLCPDLPYFLNASNDNVSNGKLDFTMREDILEGKDEIHGLISSKVTLDLDNDYLELVGSNGNDDFKVTLTFFDQADKTKVLFWALVDKAPPGGTSYQYRYYAIQKNGDWYSSEDMGPEDARLPALSLTMVGPGAPAAIDEKSVEWELVLPRVGGTILAIPHIGPANRSDPLQWQNLNNELVNFTSKHGSLYFIWHPTTGRFTLNRN